MIFNFAEFPVTLNLPDLAGKWTTVIHSADASWNGPERNLASEITLLTAGELRLSPHSFLVIERTASNHGGGVKYVCIHGHFYQPPRENPYLEAIELQDSAYPYHDWNERITAECYAPNAASRILDAENRILKLLNNYAQISFNFGPTLLSWMKDQAPQVYQAILEADQKSARTIFRTRIRDGAGLQPHDPASRQSPRQGDSGQVGNARF